LTGRTCAEIVDGTNLGFGEDRQLESGLNVFESTLSAVGRYSYSCWMGMFRASVTAIEEPA